MPNLTQDKVILVNNFNAVLRHAQDVLSTLNEQQPEYAVMDGTIKTLEGLKKAVEAAFKTAGY